MTSPTEHASILEVVGEGILLIDNNGVIRLDALEELCSTQQVPFMVSVMIANNETGVIQPIAEIANIVHRYGGIIHTDAIQALGKIPINLPELGVDLLTLSAHKVGGPLGVGALIMKKFLPLKPLLQGGGQEFRYRSGSHNIPGIYAFVVAAELAVKRLGEYALLSRLRDGLEERIARINTDTIFFGQKAHRLPNTSSFTMANVLSETQVIYFDLKGVAISAGAACSSGKSAIPHVQMSMGYTEAVARTSIRMSLGLDSAPEDIDCFVEAWEELYCNSNKMISGV
jgi:cysteine desulfurase